MTRLASLVLACVLFAACGDDAAEPGPGESTTASSSSTSSGGPESGDLPCDVRTVIADNCAQCHSDPPRFGAPMPLVDAADFDAEGRDGRPYHESVPERVRDAVAPMPPAPAERLDDGELAVLDAWLAAGRPAATTDDCDAGEGGGYPEPEGLDCEVDTIIARAEPYAMPASVEDETKCFGIELTNDGPRKHIIGMGPSVDEERILHHFLLFRAPTAQSAEAFDCSLFPPDWTLLYAWAPGAPAQNLPEEAGFPLEEGETAHLVLQMHYNNYAGVVDPVDDTRVDLCTTTDLRPNDAGVMAFGGTSFTIPPRDDLELTCSFEAPEPSGGALPVTIFQSWPHMHALGRSLRTTVEKANGDVETLVDVPQFSYQSQLLYPADLDLEEGDRVTTTCGWSNTTDAPVSYGEASDAEMCFNIVTYYPAITVDGFTPALPTSSAVCTTE
jgi:mono/diheme cytochrome c family protein